MVDRPQRRRTTSTTAIDGTQLTSTYIVSSTSMFSARDTPLGNRHPRQSTGSLQRPDPRHRNCLPAIPCKQAMQHYRIRGLTAAHSRANPAGAPSPAGSVCLADLEIPCLRSCSGELEPSRPAAGLPKSTVYTGSDGKRCTKMEWPTTATNRSITVNLALKCMRMTWTPLYRCFCTRLLIYID